MRGSRPKIRAPKYLYSAKITVSLKKKKTWGVTWGIDYLPYWQEDDERLEHVGNAIYTEHN